MQAAHCVLPSSSFAASKSSCRASNCAIFNGAGASKLSFCGLRKEVLGLPVRGVSLTPRKTAGLQYKRGEVTAFAWDNGGPPTAASFDYDVIIIGAGVGGHGAALHAVEKGLKTAIVEGYVVGGTCVNRGCVPSKALLAVSGRMREFQSEHHLKAMGIQVHIGIRLQQQDMTGSLLRTMQTILLQRSEEI